MPVNTISTTPILLANLASNSILGVSAPQLALAVATSFEIYCSSGLTVNSVDTGTLGIGVGSGIGMIIPVPVLVSSLTASFASNAILGVMAPLVINALAISFAQILSTAIIIVSDPTVGVGAGVATLVPNGVVSLLSYQTGFQTSGLVGSSTAQLVSAISQGFDIASTFAIGAVALVGTPSLIGSVGIGTGIIQ